MEVVDMDMDMMIKTFFINLILCFIFVSNIWAISEYEATAYIGKEVEMQLHLYLKNTNEYFHIKGLILDVVNLDAKYAGHYVVVNTEYINEPILISCDSITYIRRLD
jgi:hypothetical protein